MGRTYNLMSKSDMRRFERDLMQDVKRVAKDAIIHDGVDISCPLCGATMHARSGASRCPTCGKTTDVSFDWSNF